MARNHHLLLALFLAAAAAGTTTTTATSSSGNSTTTPTAYEMLERYDFPRGILPEGVQRYELRPADGSFEVFLSDCSGSCEFRVGDRYLLRYDCRIAGTAREGSIRALQGVSVKVLFVWLPITEVDRAGDQLSFLVGPLAASFPLENFAESPRCQCGFDCAAAAAAAS
jgi:hypothetical protein